MADIHCPMCGKSNPEKLDECQYCGARLKPMVAPPSGGSIRPGVNPPSKDVSDPEKGKTGGVEAIRPGVAPTRKDTGELEKALPDWLRSLRDSQDQTESPAGDDADLSAASDRPSADADLLAGLNQASSAEEEGVPDWLAGLRGEKTEEPAAPSELESGAASDWGNADWMSRLDDPSKGSEARQETPPAEGTPTSFDPQEETPDWIKALKVDLPSQEPPEGGEIPPREKMPDWFSGLPDIPAEDISSADKTAEPAPREKIPDWLAQLQESSTQAPTAPSQEPFENEPASEAGGTAPAENLPDWLDQLQEKNLPAQQPATGETGSADIPGWLAEQASVPSAEAPLKVENLPDWLNSLNPASEAASSDTEEDLPDWLGSTRESGAAEPEPPAAPAEKIPDWLSNLGENAPPENKPAEENVPDWLSEGETSTPAGTPAEAEKGELPGWLSDMQEKSTAAPESGEEVQSPQSATPETPGWLNDIEKTVQPAAEQPPFIQDTQGQGSEAFSTETPDWLSKVAPEPGAEKNAAEEPPAGTDNLEAGALPTWVQAMRPLESVVTGKAGNPRDEQTTEQSGPLAGLVGVLPAGPGLGSIRKPPTYSVKLQLSEMHQRYMEHFDQLIADETKAHTAKTTRLASHYLWRIVITLVLLAAVMLPFLTQTHFIPAPSGIVSGDTPYSTSGVSKGATAAILEALPANAPVLLAFDYEPALSSELEAVSAPLVDQLMAKGARLAIVSTSPTGPALAEQFLQAALLVNSHQYQAGQQYINLGYLAGGSAAISAFAASPSQTMPYTLAGQPAWGSSVLQGVGQLSDFSAVFILTDSAETGRNWVEQASQFLGSTPMLMVVSAQAEPMVRPYFDSGQLKGLVSGLMDAMVYEAAYKRPGLANHYWDAYSLGVLAAEILIVIGAAWGALGSWRSRQKSHGEEG